jgi:hypothetical protein
MAQSIAPDPSRRPPILLSTGSAVATGVAAPRHHQQSRLRNGAAILNSRSK